MNDKLLPPGDGRIGETPDGPIGPPAAMRPRLELWKRQQAALEAGEDPTLIDSEADRDLSSGRVCSHGQR